MSPATAVIHGHEVFRATLHALAHPGRPFVLLGVPDADTAVAALVHAVYEPTTPAWSQDTWPPPVTLGHVRLGDAELLLVRGSDSSGAVTRARRGSGEHPSHGATVIYAATGADTRTPVTLTGPGVDGTLRTTLALSVDELTDRAAACARRPLGVDVLLVSVDGAITGLPRSTRVEVTG